MNFRMKHDVFREHKRPPCLNDPLAYYEMGFLLFANAHPNSNHIRIVAGEINHNNICHA